MDGQSGRRSMENGVVEVNWETWISMRANGIHLSRGAHYPKM